MPGGDGPTSAQRPTVLGIAQEAVPADSLLRSWQGGAHPERWIGTGDCFSVHVKRPVSLAQFVAAFYTSPVFRLERWILKLLLKAPSTDADAQALAAGQRETFAVWVSGARTETQLLMCDRYGRTRSWFCVVPDGAQGTTLRFGSAVAKPPEGAAQNARPGLGFRLLGGFHVRYSEVLLNAARKRLERSS